MLPAVRVVLLLTVGLPVFATQLVALALPGVEMVRFVPLRQLPAETHQQAQDEARVPAPRGAHRLGLAAHIVSRDGDSWNEAMSLAFTAMLD